MCVWVRKREREREREPLGALLIQNLVRGNTRLSVLWSAAVQCYAEYSHPVLYGVQLFSVCDVRVTIVVNDCNCCLTFTLSIRSTSQQISPQLPHLLGAVVMDTKSVLYQSIQGQCIEHKDAIFLCPLLRREGAALLYPPSSILLSWAQEMVLLFIKSIIIDLRCRSSSSALSPIPWTPLRRAHGASLHYCLSDGHGRIFYRWWPQSQLP